MLYITRAFILHSAQDANVCASAENKQNQKKLDNGEMAFLEFDMIFVLFFT